MRPGRRVAKVGDSGSATPTTPIVPEPQGATPVRRPEATEDRGPGPRISLSTRLLPYRPALMTTGVSGPAGPSGVSTGLRGRVTGVAGVGAGVGDATVVEAVYPTSRTSATTTRGHPPVTTRLTGGGATVLGTVRLPGPVRHPVALGHDDPVRPDHLPPGVLAASGGPSPTGGATVSYSPTYATSGPTLPDAGVGPHRVPHCPTVPVHTARRPPLRVRTPR